MSLDLTNVVVVVTRYFGGKKLGVRGLIEAYGQAARQVLEKAGRAEKVITQPIILTCYYAALERVLYHINSCGGRVVTADYGPLEVYLQAEVPLSVCEEFRQKVAAMAKVKEQKYDGQ